MLLLVDHLALRARNYEYLIQLFQEWEVSRGPGLGGLGVQWSSCLVGDSWSTRSLSGAAGGADSPEAEAEAEAVAAAPLGAEGSPKAGPQ